MIVNDMIWTWFYGIVHNDMKWIHDKNWMWQLDAIGSFSPMAVMGSHLPIALPLLPHVDRSVFLGAWMDGQDWKERVQAQAASNTFSLMMSRMSRDEMGMLMKSMREIYENMHFSTLSFFQIEHRKGSGVVGGTG